MFIDEAKIRVKAGDGGNGCMAFRREKFVPRGGPSGGDGGRGGDVVMESSQRHNTLIHFRYNPEHKAQRGEHGMGSNCTGLDGRSIVLQVPVGTSLYDAETGELVHDFQEPDERIVIAKGGRGGRGNQHFATSTHQAPREHELGRPGEERSYRLELKLLADVGLVGLPERGQVHADFAHLGRAAEDCGLSVHDARAEPGRGDGGRGAGSGILCGGRYAGVDRGRAPVARGWAFSFCGTSSARGCWFTWWTCRTHRDGPIRWKISR